ncbi:MAG: WD40/YVTN/BNR-like repeat-containing protein [Gammaproteobacteria bacterium]
MRIRPWHWSSALIFAVLCTAAQAATFNSALFSGLHWRMLGPFRSSRVTAIAGFPHQPNRYLFGAVDGGVWETDNAGLTWQPIFDHEPIGSIGALAVAPSDPNVIYVGSGEADMRSDIGYGDGMYKSTDGGRTWTHIGLTDSMQIGKILVDPNNANIVYVAALGHAYAANPERGVFKSTDGGQSWQKLLYKDADTGAIDLAFGATPETIYAALWQTRRPPWNTYPPSSGPGSGLYVSHDAGAHWTEIEGHGFASGTLGRIGIGVAPSNPRIVYANVQAAVGEGGLYRSDDGGATWTHVDSDTDIWSRWWYFGEVTVDPNNPDIVYIPKQVIYKSTDGGQSFTPFRGDPTGDDYQRLWINPVDPMYMLSGADQGASVSVDGGRSWSTWYNQPIAQMYHVTTDNQFLYWVYGAQQDSGAAALPSRTLSTVDGVSNFDFHSIAPGGESGYIAVDPLNHNLVYGTSYGGGVTMENMATGETRDLTPTLAYPGIYRSVWTMPLVFSQADPHALYFGNQRLFRTTDGGAHWEVISPDLSRPDPGIPPNLGPITAKDSPETGPRRGVIYAIAPSPLEKNLIWVGTDDGLVWLTRDGGQHWTNVTPRALTAWSKVGIIDASHFNAGTAYVAVDRHRLNDYQPYIYVTHDYGKSWKLIVNGIPDGDFVNVVREDPVKPGLLYAGTEKRVFVSFDDGGHWQSLQQNLPVTSMRDIDVHGNDLVLATLGRGFWIMDDVTALRQIDPQVADASAWLYKPAVAYRVGTHYAFGTPLHDDVPHAPNPPFGAYLDYYLKNAANTPVTLAIYDSAGKLMRQFSSAERPKIDYARIASVPKFIPVPPSLETAAGMHRFVWDLHEAPPAGLGGGDGLSAGGLWVVPGVFTVKLTVAGRTYAQPLTVKNDPRLKDVSQRDLEAQYALARAIQATRIPAGEATRAIGGLLEQLTTLAPRARGALARQISALNAKLRALSEMPANNPNNSVGVQPPNIHNLTYVGGALGQLESAVESANAAPTPDMQAGFQKQKALLAPLLQQWQQLQATELPRLNAALKSAGLAALKY